MEKIGIKHDSQKPDVALLYSDLQRELAEVVRVLEHGKEKYSRCNWRFVDRATERYLSASQRNLNEMWSANVTALDEDSKLLHAAHLACNALFLLFFALEEQS